MADLPTHEDHTGRQRTAALVDVVVGAGVLGVGWWMDVARVRQVLPGQESMKANTAVGLLLLGVAALPWSRRRPVRQVAGVLLLFLGVATLGQFATGLDLGIDQLLASDPAVSGSGPGRMSLSTAVAFTLVACSVLVMPSRRGPDIERRATIGTLTAFVAGLIALMNLMAYVFGSVAEPGVAPTTQMALNTSVGLLFGCFAAIDANAIAGPMSPVYSTTAAGRVVRALGPVTAVGLLVSGGIVAALGRSGLVESARTELALQATLGVTAVMIVVMLVARRLEAAVAEAEASRRELLVLNAELEQRVAERTAQLDATVADLERSNAELEQFAYVASHDLQEPLRMVSSFVQRIGDRYGDDLDERGQEYVRLAVDGAQRMSALIDALLRYSRVGRAELELQEVDVGELLDDVLQTFVRRLDEAGGSVEVETPMPRLVADPTLLRQVLQNLVGNALKFARPDVPPVVHVRAHRDGDAWVLEVEDDGIGIDPRFRDEVFRMFRRLNARRSYGGTGIGLSITQRIVERHGGDITVGDPTGTDGTRMVVRLPDRPEVSP